MKISESCVATLHYALTDSAGELIESSFESEPFAYLHGANNIIPGLEQALEGKQADDEFTVDVPARDAYGEYDPQRTQTVELNMFDGMDVSPGMQFHAQTPNGMEVVTVKSVDGDAVVIDGNHPMAGMDLTFSVKVLSVREATSEETAHGHVHAGGESCGHSH